MIERLLSSGADANTMGLDGSTALHEAILISNNKVTTLLIKNGIEVNRRILKDFPHGDDVSALQIASRRMDIETAAQLLKAGALPDSRSIDHALDKHNFQMLRLLLSHGGTLDLASLSTKNALGEAGWRGQKALQRLLTGHSTVPEFMHLNAEQLENIMNESDRPLGSIINDLRRHLEAWISQSVPTPGTTKNKLCCHCENIASSAIPIPLVDANSIKLNTCPLCRIIFDEKLWFREKTNEGKLKQTLT